MPCYKIIANRFLTTVENYILGTHFSELHTGYRAYSREFLETVPFLRNSNDFVFDSQIIAQSVVFEQRVEGDPGRDPLLPGGLLDEPQAEHRLRPEDPRGDAALPASHLGQAESRDLPAVKRSAWLDPADLRSAIALALLAAAANAIWVFLDHSTPSWDQSSYLTVAITFRDALQNGGPKDLFNAIRDTDPARGPLFTTSILPFMLVFGDGARTGLLPNLVLAPVLYLAAGQIAWIVFRNGAARLLAIVFVATMPLLVGLQHEVLQDFVLLTLTTVSILLLLMGEGFTRRWYCVGLGVAMGLGTLTKVTFPIFVLGPLLVVLIEVAYAHFSARRAGERGPDLGATAVNLGLAALAYVVVIAPWYLTNLQPTLDYINSTTSGPLSEGAGPEHPFTFHAIASFTIVDDQRPHLLGPRPRLPRCPRVQRPRR